MRSTITIALVSGGLLLASACSSSEGNGSTGYALSGGTPVPAWGTKVVSTVMEASGSQRLLSEQTPVGDALWLGNAACSSAGVSAEFRQVLDQPFCSQIRPWLDANVPTSNLGFFQSYRQGCAQDRIPATLCKQ